MLHSSDNSALPRVPRVDAGSDTLAHLLIARRADLGDFRECADCLKRNGFSFLTFDQVEGAIEAARLRQANWAPGYGIAFLPVMLCAIADIASSQAHAAIAKVAPVESAGARIVSIIFFVIFCIAVLSWCFAMWAMDQADQAAGDAEIEDFLADRRHR